jgi:hypothetical protein
MTRTFPPSSASLLLSAGSLLLGLVSMTLGRRVNYLDYLTLFNSMAAAMLALGAAALAAGVIGTWKSRGRSGVMWLASAIAVLILCLYLLDG